MSSNEDLKNAIFQLIDSQKEDRALSNARFERIEGSISELIAAHGQTTVSLAQSTKHEVAEDQQFQATTQELASLKQTIVNVAEAEDAKIAAEDAKIAATQEVNATLDAKLESTRASAALVDAKVEEAHQENVQLKAELDAKTEAIHKENLELKAELATFNAQRDTDSRNLNQALQSETAKHDSYNQRLATETAQKVTQMETLFKELNRKNDLLNEANKNLTSKLEASLQAHRELLTSTLAASEKKMQDTVSTHVTSLTETMTSELNTLKIQHPSTAKVSTQVSDKATVMTDIRLTFPSLVLDATDPRLASCTKPYGEVRLNTSSDTVLTTQSDFEPKIQQIQRDLLLKQVRFADWTMFLASLCDDKMLRKLRDPNHKFLNWSDALYTIFCHTDFLARSCKHNEELIAMNPAEGQSLRTYFDLLFDKAAEVVHFPVHGTLFSKIQKTLAAEYPMLLTSSTMRLLTNADELRMFLHKHLPENVLYHVPKVTSPTGLFAVSHNVRVADTYRCTNCHCTKCQSRNPRLKPGYCINCSCSNCKQHRRRPNTAATKSNFRINRISTVTPDETFNSSVVDDADFTNASPIFASDPMLNPTDEDDEDSEFETIDLPSAEYIHYGVIPDNDLPTEGNVTATTELQLNQIKARQ